MLKELRELSTTASTGAIPKCSLCNDTQLVPRPTPDYPNAWGHCDCLIAEIRARRYEVLAKRANLGSMHNMKLEAYEPDHPIQRKALEAIAKEHRGYYLYGPWGVGKTHLMAGTVHRAIARRIPAVIISVPQLLDMIRKTGRDSNTDIEDMAAKIPYLCMDDIGKQKDTDWTEERLFMLIDERWKLYQTGKAHTSFTSQYPLELLAERLDGAIISRIRGMCKVLFIDGKDKREKA